MTREPATRLTAGSRVGPGEIVGWLGVDGEVYQHAIHARAMSRR